MEPSKLELAAISKSAFPSVLRFFSKEYVGVGLLKREYIATRILEASIKNDPINEHSVSDHARFAVKAADALLEELAK